MFVLEVRRAASDRDIRTGIEADRLDVQPQVAGQDLAPCSLELVGEVHHEICDDAVVPEGRAR